jgi:hypothetical protein
MFFDTNSHSLEIFNTNPIDLQRWEVSWCYTTCNAIFEWMRPALCLPSGRGGGWCTQSTRDAMWLDVREHTDNSCFFPCESHPSEDYTVLYRDPPVWWDPQSKIPAWLWGNGLLVLSNLGVCGQAYSRKDWQITETYQSGIISILSYGIDKP